MTDTAFLVALIGWCFAATVVAWIAVRGVAEWREDRRRRGNPQDRDWWPW